MDDLGDLFGSMGDALGEMFGGGEAQAAGVAAFLSPEARRRGANAAPPPAVERYLCGKPRELNINDR